MITIPFERINVQLAVKLEAGDTIPAALLQVPTQAQINAMKTMTWLQIIREMIRRMKQYSENINEGQDRMELTVIAKRHTCRHDLFPNEPCVEEDI